MLIHAPREALPREHEVVLNIEVSMFRISLGGLSGSPLFQDEGVN